MVVAVGAGPLRSVLVAAVLLSVETWGLWLSAVPQLPRLPDSSKAASSVGRGVDCALASSQLPNRSAVERGTPKGSHPEGVSARGEEGRLVGVSKLQSATPPGDLLISTGVLTSAVSWCRAMGDPKALEGGVTSTLCLSSSTSWSLRLA